MYTTFQTDQKKKERVKLPKTLMRKVVSPQGLKYWKEKNEYYGQNYANKFGNLD